MVDYYLIAYFVEGETSRAVTLPDGKQENKGSTISLGDRMDLDAIVKSLKNIRIDLPANIPVSFINMVPTGYKKPERMPFSKKDESYIIGDVLNFLQYE